jgi:hypothetical protein
MSLRTQTSIYSNFDEADARNIYEAWKQQLAEESDDRFAETVNLTMQRRFAGVTYYIEYLELLRAEIQSRQAHPADEVDTTHGA